MGPEFEKMSKTEFYWGLKHSLYKNGINLEMARTREGEDLFLLKSIKEITPEITESLKPKIPIISPTEVPSNEKKFFISIIKKIEELEVPINQNIIVFNIMMEGTKFAINQNIEVEDLLDYYHADKRTYYFFGILDTVEKFEEIIDFIKTYSTSDEEFKLYLDLYISGISLISDIYERKESIPYMNKIIEDIDSIIKEESDPKIVWEEIKNYTEKID